MATRESRPRTRKQVETTMAANILLHAVLIGVAATTAMKLVPNLMQSDKQFREACKDVFEYAATCDDAVGDTETFKTNKMKYAPLVPMSVFPQAVADCVENSLSVLEMAKVCRDAQTFKKAMRCYRRTMMLITPPDGKKAIDELVTVYENCMVGMLNASMATTAPTMAPTTAPTQKK